MKSYIRLAAIAASLLATTIAAPASILIDTWTDWYASHHPEWPSLVYADNSNGELYASGGDLYGGVPDAGNYYYTLFDTPDLRLDPGAILSGLSTVELFFGETWNEDYGPQDLTLHYTLRGSSTVYSRPATAPVVSGKQVNLSYTWTLPDDVDYFWFTWSLLEHSTFNALIITQST
ncbi:MAG: hypothetical protein LBK99_11765 [Opitutaceae bacterium]|jgi:hypothetical protein|nr:hypothetical protein [Opitutaceae bacterium]